MSYWPEPHPKQHNVISIPTFGIAIALSLLLHVAIILQWKIQLRTPETEIPPPLTVKLEPLPGPPASAPVLVPPPPAAPAPPRTARVAPSVPPPLIAAPRPPVIALPQPAPAAPSEPAVASPSPLRIPPATDLAAYIESQRRARTDTTPATPQPAEDENARATRLAVANLATPKARGFGQDPTRGGGVFQIKSKGVDYAEFMFYGWHADARRDLSQLVEVRKGSNSTIELAVVRRMIDIIRSYEQADFSWHSYRLNRSVMLSARPRDSAGLEDFLMREFFYNPRTAP
jgi:hypothetical protein